MNIENSEEIEGLGQDEDASLGEYPIDTLLIRHESRTVHDVLRRIEKGAFVMDPDFQRDFVWDDEKQSKLIESVLMRIPLPVFYLGEDDQGRMVVVDGLQRLSTFNRFVNGSFKLKLPKQSELDKKSFNDLSPKLQNRIEDCNLILYIIDSKVPERARLDIFERVNSGVPLSRQQMRNCLYSGKATKFLKAETETEIFKKATGGSLKVKTMRDREFVNRFCAFKLLPLSEYNNDMDEWLAMALKRMDTLDEVSLQKLSDDFRNSLQNNHLLFQDHAFRKSRAGSSRRSVLNASLWDVMITGFTGYSKKQVASNYVELTNRFYNLIDDERFNWSITYGPNGSKQVEYRFQATQKMFAEVFSAHSS